MLLVGVKGLALSRELLPLPLWGELLVLQVKVPPMVDKVVPLLVEVMAM